MGGTDGGSLKQRLHRASILDLSASNPQKELHKHPLTPAHQGGTFILNISFPHEYPFKAPVLSFGTKIYHPNVSNDGKGSMCLGMLRPDEWKPPNKIRAVLLMVRNLLLEPNVDDAIETSIAEQYKSQRREFEKTAKEWVRQFARK